MPHASERDAVGAADVDNAQTADLERKKAPGCMIAIDFVNADVWRPVVCEEKFLEPGDLYPRIYCEDFLWADVVVRAGGSRGSDARETNGQNGQWAGIDGELAPQRFDIVGNGGHRFGNITATDVLL